MGDLKTLTFASFWPFQRLHTHSALQGHLAEASSSGEDWRSALQGKRVWLPPVQSICPLKLKLSSVLVFVFCRFHTCLHGLWYLCCLPAVPVVLTSCPKCSFVFFPPQGYLAELFPFTFSRGIPVFYMHCWISACCIQVPWIAICTQWILKLGNSILLSQNILLWCPRKT